MANRVELTARAGRNLRRIYQIIDAVDYRQVRAWFDGLEAAVFSLDENPARGSPTLEDANLRQLLYGNRRNVYRIIYVINERPRLVTVLHIRHGSRQAFSRE